MSDTSKFLAREFERTNEDLMREVNKLVRAAKNTGDAVREGMATMVTDTDWLCATAAKIERLVEKRNVLSTLIVVASKE